MLWLKITWKLVSKNVFVCGGDGQQCCCSFLGVAENFLTFTCCVQKSYTYTIFCSPAEPLDDPWITLSPPPSAHFWGNGRGGGERMFFRNMKNIILCVFLGVSGAIVVLLSLLASFVVSTRLIRPGIGAITSEVLEKISGATFRWLVVRKCSYLGFSRLVQVNLLTISFIRGN